MLLLLHILSTYFYIYHTHKSQHIIHIITTININSHCHHDPMDFHSPKVTFISRITGLFMRPLTIILFGFSLLLLVAFVFWFHWTKVLHLLLFNKLQLFFCFVCCMFCWLWNHLSYECKKVCVCVSMGSPWYGKLKYKIKIIIKNYDWNISNKIKFHINFLTVV